MKTLSRMLPAALAMCSIFVLSDRGESPRELRRRVAGICVKAGFSYFFMPEAQVDSTREVEFHSHDGDGYVRCSTAAADKGKR